MLKQVGISGKTVGGAAGDDSIAGRALDLARAIPETIDAIAPEDGSAPMRAAEELATRHAAALCLLADAIDCREQFNPGSSLRVLEHASRFALALGLNNDDRIALERGALLRDLGKLRVPNDVLLKHSLLTYDEWLALQEHTRRGAELAVSIPGLSYIAPVARSHHECFDGTGYPDGQEGEQIPLFARVVKIVDVYCAMTSPRIYRATVASRDEAFDYLREEREKHFDPELVDLFIEKEIGDVIPADVSESAIPAD